MKISTTVNETTLTIQCGEEAAIVVDLNTLETLHSQLAMHGLKQKLCDSAAGNAGMKDAHARITQTLNALKAGQWNAGRTGTGGDMVEAFMRATGKTRQECADRLATASDEQKAAIRKHPDMVKHMAAIKAERKAQIAAADVNAPDLNDLF